MKRLVNPVVRFLLSSPAHRLLSGGVLLISVRGRRSGRTYTTPVQYAEKDGELFVLSRRSRSWWRNIAVNSQVTLRLRGRDVRALAFVLAGTDGMDAYERSSLARAAKREDAVRIRLTSIASTNA